MNGSFPLVIFSLLIIFSCNNTEDYQIASDEFETLTNPTEKQDAKVNWMTLEEAEKAMLKEPKSMFVMVYANWCSNSQKFDETTYQNPEIINKLNNDFYPVKLNAHEPYDLRFKGVTYANPNFDAAKGLDKMNAYHEVLFQLEAKSVPSTVFLNKDRIVVGSEMGYKNPNVFKTLLNEYQYR